ncbi:copper amine oxidase N-terminal domain-containing protein, partial [Bacillus subtilis]|uniref:copper amine oxidase N-terminal domain-containing protein n=1 Tax=Bacillus subtilis TaxID=1423 RepID=UPI003F7B3E86
MGDQAYALEAAPFIEDGRTYVPLRFVSEQLNASVNWNPDTQEVQIAHNDTVLKWTVGNKQVSIDDTLAV